MTRSGGHGPVGRSGGPSSSTTWSSFCSAPTTHATRRCCWATPPRDSSTITRSSSAWCSAACGSAALRPAAERPAARRLAPCSLGLCALWPCVLRLNALRSLRPSGLQLGSLHTAELPRPGGLRLSTCGCAPAAHPAAACPATVRFAALHPQLSALRPCGGRLCTLRLSALRPNGLRLNTRWLSVLRPGGSAPCGDVLRLSTLRLSALRLRAPKPTACGSVPAAERPAARRPSTQHRLVSVLRPGDLRLSAVVRPAAQRFAAPHPAA